MSSHKIDDATASTIISWVVVIVLGWIVLSACEACYTDCTGGNLPQGYFIDDSDDSDESIDVTNRSAGSASLLANGGNIYGAQGTSEPARRFVMR